METLLPSEVARLVLGYLEEEKCTEAAKCFLNTSPDLSEIRSIAQKGRKYPTKVNGYSLKEVLDEYCLVHSIVQDCLASMSEQPSGGSMIDCLRHLVRACQPVQVHINLHPQQGQSLSCSKMDISDTTPTSRPRSKKNSISQGQNAFEFDLASTSQPVVSQTLPDSSSSQKLGGLSLNDSPCPSQTYNMQPSVLSVVANQGVLVSQNVTANVQFSASASMVSGNCKDGGLLQETEQQPHCIVNDVAHHSTFQNNLEIYHEASSRIASQQISESMPPGKYPQQQMHQIATNANESVLKASNAESLHQSMVDFGTLRPETAVLQETFTKPEESLRSNTLIKSYGSNIVILDSDTNISQPCVSTNAVLPGTSSQDNDARKALLVNKLVTPSKANIHEALSEKIIKNEIMVTKLVENINRVLTPAKLLLEKESQPIGEGSQDLDEAVHSILKETTEDPSFDQFLHEFLQFENEAPRACQESDEDQDSNPKDQRKKKKKKQVRKKPSDASTKLKQPSQINIGAEGTSSTKQPSDKYEASVANFVLPEGATPIKTNIENETMTPITKLLKSMTSPSGDLFMDPTQFPSLIEVSDSPKVVKQTPSIISETPLQVQQSESSNMSHGTFLIQQGTGTVLVPCRTIQDLGQLISEKGVKNICEIQVVPSGPYIPIAPKIPIGTSLAEALGSSQPCKPKRKPRPKRCLTRGGRQAAGQMRADSQETRHLSNDTDKETGAEKNTVTLYAENGKSEVSSTISYCVSSDLPILVSDASSAQKETQPKTNLAKSASAQMGHELTTSQPEPAVSESQERQSCLPTIPENEEAPSNRKEDNNLPSLDASVIRNTPGLTGPPKPNEKRLSYSTPRRHSSHIRALDFNTPPKGNDQSLRRANTSPKNTSSAAFSPRTAGKLMKSTMPGSLLKPPTDGLRRTSKVKAHLFKSPDYPMCSSSGYKVPSSAVTSTPAEEVQGPSIAQSPIPTTPSTAWDKVGGVSLILDSDISPVVRIDPPCKKELPLKSWDSELRCAIGSVETAAAPAPSRKRRTNPPVQKKGNKKTKKTEEKEPCSDDKETCSEDKAKEVQEISNESESEMARMIEDNLMDSSFGAASPVKRASYSKSGTELSPVKADVEDKTKDNVHSNAIMLSSDVLTQTDSDVKLPKDINQSEQSKNSTATCGTLSFVAEQGASTAKTSENTTDVLKDTLSAGKVVTPVLDSSAISAADRIRLNQATWKEGFSFDTPMKDDLANIVPQTPRFLDPSSTSREDTPHTKIIKAIAYPMSSADNAIGTPILSVPPTPTIHTTSSVSPSYPSYFKADQSSPASNSREHSKRDNLENILIQECTRIEAGGMRESVKMLKRNSQVKSVDAGVLETLKDDAKVLKQIDGASQEETGEICVTPVGEGIVDKSGHESSKSSILSSEIDHDVESRGCARLMLYKRKSTSEETVGNVVKTVFPGVSKQSVTVSGDESDDFLIVSPNKTPCNREYENNDIMVKTCVEVVPEKDISQEPLLQVASQINGVDIEVALDHIHGKVSVQKQLKSTSNSIQSTKKLPLGPVLISEQNQVHLNAPEKYESPLKNVLVKSLPTPEKTKASASKRKNSSPKKKSTPAKEADQVVTDDESSNSSLSESSSDSDSNSSSSSSSSSEEGTPVKENISPSKQINSFKAKSPQILDRREEPIISNLQLSKPAGNDEKILLELAESKEGDIEKTGEEKVTEKTVEKLISKSEHAEEQMVSEKTVQKSTTVLEQTEENRASETTVQKSITKSGKANEGRAGEKTVGKLTTKPEKAGRESRSEKAVEKLITKSDSLIDLKSLISTKDMGSCEKIAKTRSAHNPRSSVYLPELQMKRLRTLEQLKKGPSARRSLMDLKGKVPAPESNVSQTKTLKLKEPNASEIICNNKVITKDQNLKDILEPKKRRSQSENQKKISDEKAADSSVRRRCVSDGAKLSDEDEEFKLHLSGDEKEESPPKSPPKVVKLSYDTVEMQIAALHGQDLKEIEIEQSSHKTATLCSQSSVCPEASTESRCDTAKLPVHSLKIAPKSAVSSKASDNLIKALMEKGFDCKLPPLPTQRIKKIDPVANKDTCVSSQLKEGSSEKSEMVFSQKSSLSIASSHNGNLLDTNVGTGGHDTGYEEIVTSSADDPHEIRVIYKGLGVARAKKRESISNVYPTFKMDDCLIRLNPSAFISLFEGAPEGRNSENDSNHERGQQSGLKKAGDKLPRNESRRIPHGCRDGVESRHRMPRDKSPRERSPKDRSPRDRDLRQHINTKSRRRRSPSPRGRHSRDFNDQDYSRDSHRRKDFHRDSRTDHHLRRQEVSTSRGRKYSETEARSTDSLISKSKLTSKGLLDQRSTEPLASKSKSSLKRDVEEGEVSSESDFETKPNRQRRRVSSPSSSRRSSKGRANNPSYDNDKRNSQQSRKPSSPQKERGSSEKLPRQTRHHIYQRAGSEREEEAHNTDTSDANARLAASEKTANKPRKNGDAKKHLEDDVTDTDLDCVNFPVLGDEDADTDAKDTEPRASQSDEQMGMVTRRRAPPRSVNAHKVAENQTPVQRGKRKLSTSPDVASEDSCQSSSMPDSKQLRTSRRSKKPAIVPGSKILTPNKSEDVADSTEILKNLDVDSFLSKIHG